MGGPRFRGFLQQGHLQTPTDEEQDIPASHHFLSLPLSLSTMAPTSLLLLRRRLRPPTSFPFCMMMSKSHHPTSAKPFSSSPQPDPAPPPPAPTPPPWPDHRAGLSARMSFVFDQIDAMERMRGAKDEALQQIRAWRQTKHQDHHQQEQQQQQQQQGDVTGGVGNAAAEVEWSRAVQGGMGTGEEGRDVFKKEVELVHPWPEWIELMEMLVRQNYFDHRRFDEEQMVKNLPIELSGIADDVGLDFTRDWATVRTACLNFGRDRFDILRSLSKKDLQVLVGNGCPSTDKKMVFSAKLLRKHAHLDEGDVCSSCKLRSTCSSGYLPTHKEDEARTLDVMRILLTFGFDSINSSVENKDLTKMKSMKTVIRKLLHDIVKLGAVPIDPNLPLPVIKRPLPKVKQPPPPPKKRVGRDDIEMKKGDWLCPKCDFMNFAKNIVCLQCDAKRPKRQLLPGEWECPECNFLNYRRNMACFHCDQKRPPDEFTENKMQFKQQGFRMRLDRTAGLSNVSNACNFDFDDNESDGADVAAFEFADPPRISGGSPDSSPQRGITRGFEDGISEDSSMPRMHNEGRYFLERDERASSHSSRTGLDDFDDEDDDVDSYEIDKQPGNPIHQVSAQDMSGFENSAESEDFDDFHLDNELHQGFNAASSGLGEDDDQSADSDSEIPNHPNWKSFKNRVQATGGNNQNRERSLSSDGGLELDSDLDDNMDLEFSSRQRRGVEQTSGRRGSERMRNYDSDDELFGSGSKDIGFVHSSRNKIQRNGSNRKIRGNSFRDFDQSDSPVSRSFGKGSGMNNRGITFGDTDVDWPYGGSRRNSRGARANDNYAQRGRNEKYVSRGSNRSRKDQFDYKQGRNSNQFIDRSGCFDEYGERGRSNQWNNRSRGF